MTCLEAQSKIIAYIDYNLEREEKKAFLKHIETCDNCREELNIYYTMIVGMRQLDANEDLARDFTEELNQRIAHERSSSRKKHSFLHFSFASVLLVGIFILIFIYTNFLDFLEQKEQQQLKNNQGDYYYSEIFSDVLFDPYTRNIAINIEEENPQPTFYERVRNYRAINSD